MTRYTFPHFEMTPEAVQPDYAKWQSVQIGMSLDEVTEILGQPRKDEYLAANQPYLSYGYIQLPFVPHPRTYRFLVGFDDHGHVFTKQDPFNGRFSVDGLPTTPELIVPADMQVFSHFPRVVDIRWFPVSGKYPVTYTVELGSFPFPELDGAPRGVKWIDEVFESDLVSPYFVTSFGGACPGRIRVRARNDLGESNWSDSRRFRFTI